MDITIKLSAAFRRAFKAIAKRHRTLPNDLEKLIVSLKENPLQGIDLGNGLRKVRMSITSKGKGKSGGARVITCTTFLTNDGILGLISIYDKADKETLSDAELRQLLNEFYSDDSQ